MEMTVKDERKLVEIWLTNAEKSDPVLRAGLQGIYDTYKKKKYLVTDPIYSIRQTVVHGLLMSIRKDGLQTRLMRHYLKISVSV